MKMFGSLKIHYGKNWSISFFPFTYLADLLNIDKDYSEEMVDKIYQNKIKLNKANTYNTKAQFPALNLSISNDIQEFSIKIYGKWDVFDLGFDLL